MTLSDKVRRLGERLRLPEWRRFGALLLTGKLMGIAVLMLGILVFNPSLLGFGALAQTADTLKATDIVNPFNTVWTLVAAFLVFGMQVGFTMLEAGFCRSRETVNVLMECIVDTCLCGLLFFAFGFAFMFSHGNGFIGMNWFFLQGAPATYEASGVAFLAFWLFQFAFADTCSTITSGAMIGRTGFVGDLIYSFAVSGFIYPIIGHWAWGPDGFLATMGSAGNFLPSLGMNFHDFAGSTVVHTIGGMVALALSNADTPVRPARGACGTAAAEVGTRIHAIRTGVDFRVDQVVGRAFQSRVRSFGILGKHEQLATFEAAQQDVAHLRGRLAASEVVHIHATDLQQLP